MRDKRDCEDIWRTWEGRKKARCTKTIVGESRIEKDEIKTIKMNSIT